MESDAILTFSSARDRDVDVRVGPSPVLELVYAVYYLARAEADADETLPWARRLLRDAPDLADAAAALVRRDPPGPGMTMFPLALESGHAHDDDPGDFLDALPELAERIVPALIERHADKDPDVAAWLRDPPDPAWPASLQATLRRLWTEIGPTWQSDGRPAAEAAAEAVRAGLSEHGDVVRALPEHHFAQFEGLAESLRAAAERGRLCVVPLALGSGGGFHVTTDAATALGFGLRTDHVHERNERRVAEAAASAKALADPTRLMLLHLVARYPDLSMTVGDLARQLEVSQPTVSGHLKQLRDAGLVTTERRGNRSYPRLRPEAVRGALEALADLLDDDAAR